MVGWVEGSVARRLARAMPGGVCLSEGRIFFAFSEIQHVSPTIVRPASGSQFSTLFSFPMTQKVTAS